MSDSIDPTSKRYWLRFGGHDVEVRPGDTLLGRHETCQIVLDDALVSRRHARLALSGGRLIVEDLGSVNGVLVNGTRIERPVQLTSGDIVRLGGQRMEVYIGADAPSRARMGSQTLSGSMVPNLYEREEATGIRDGEALTTLATVAEKVLAMGRGNDAERILQKAMETVQRRVKAGEPVDRDNVELAAAYAVKFADALNKGSWVDYTFELYMSLGRVLPGAIVDQLYTTVRNVAPIDVERLRAYIRVLQSRQSLSPGDLFLLRRIEGLERLVALK